MAISVSEIGKIRGLLPFSAVMLMVFRLVSMSVHCKKSKISPILAPVSLSVCRAVAVFGVPAEIRLSNSFSVGIKGIFLCILYFGFFHFFPKNFKKPSYIVVMVLLVLFDHLCLEISSLTSSGS